MDAPMSDLDDRLQELVKIACQHEPGSRPRNRALTEIIRLVTPHLWKENVPYYGDALQLTFIYLSRKVHNYDPQRASVKHWLNVRLKFELLTLKIKWLEEQKKKISTTTMEGKELDIPDKNQTLEAKDPNLLDAIRSWAMTDATGELEAKYMRSLPQVNCQKLILDRLQPDITWEYLANHYQSKVPNLASFYQRHCIPRLREFCQAQGYC
jgi:hypothetical protein